MTNLTSSEREEAEAPNLIPNFGPIRLVVIQSTPFCNLDCSYCYLPDRGQRHKLDIGIIDSIFKVVFTSPFLTEDFTILWHAGEPMSLPVSYYLSAFEAINIADSKYNDKSFRFNYSFQTNALFLNDVWCDFLRQHPVHVGVSIDGPEFIHNAHRKTRTGLGSFAGTMHGIYLLQKNEIPFSAIAVITNESLNYPDEIFYFFLSNGITNIGFNMEEVEGSNQKSSSLQGADIEARYRTFMQRIWDLTVQHNGAVRVREFEAICGLIYTENRLDSTDMNKPFAIVNFDSNGNFSTFYPELLGVSTVPYGDLVFGNVLEDTLESICLTEKFQSVYRDMKAGVQLCQAECPYFGICGGGAGSNKYWENGTLASSETMACRLRNKVITDIVLQALEASILYPQHKKEIVA